MDIKELIERVKLTPGEIEEAIRSNMTVDIYEKVAEAQLNKVLNDPDLVLIDRNKIGACIHYVEDAMGEKEVITPDEYIKQLPIIPLRDAMKEAQADGH